MQAPISGVTSAKSRGSVVAVRNTLLLLSSHAVKSVANFAVSFGVGRLLGEAGMGVYNCATSASEVFYSGAELGVSAHLKRTLAREPDRSESCVQAFTLLRLLLVPVGMLVVGVYGWSVGLGNYLPAMALVAAASGLGFVWVIYEALFVAREDIPAVFLGNAPFYLLLMLATGAWYFARGTLVQLAGVLAVVALLQVLFAGRLSWQRAGVRPGLRWLPRVIWPELKQSWPIGLSTLLAIATMKAPVLIVIAYTRDAEMVGRFAGVQMLINAAAVLQMSISNVAFPKLARTAKSAPADFRRMVLISSGILALFGVLFAGVMTGWGGPLVTLIFGWAPFPGLNDLAAVLGWSCPLLLLAHHYIYVFAAMGRDRVHAILMAAGFLSVSVLVPMFLSLYGLTGAAWGVLLGRGVVLIGMIVAYFWYLSGSKTSNNVSGNHPSGGDPWQ